MPAGTRDHASELSIFNYTGFRVIMYKDVFNFSENAIKEIAAGNELSTYIDKNGFLWGSGFGLPTENNIVRSKTPKRILENNIFIKTSIKERQNFAIDIDGQLWRMGE